MISNTRRRDWSQGGVMDNGGGCSHRAFYRIVGWRKVDNQGEEGNGGGTSMTLVTEDGNGEGETMGCGCF
jgi:hypothetical protein